MRVLKRTVVAIQCGVLVMCMNAPSACAQDDAPQTPPGRANVTSVVEVTPKGDFADVDTKLIKEAVHRLGVPSTRVAAIKDVTAQPARYAPPVLYAVASAMFSDGRRTESLFWFYLGQLRARSDANKCKDVSARQAVQVLNMQYGAPINKFAFNDTDKLRKVVNEVLEWDRTHPRSYDPRWIVLHGMGAFLGKSDTFSEESKWKQIDESTRTEYRKGFEQGLAHFVKLKAELDTNGDGVISDGERKAHQEKEMARFRKQIEDAMRDLKIEKPK